MKGIKKGNILVIYWVDTFSLPGWYSNKELEAYSKKYKQYIKSSGIFAGEYNGFILISTLYNNFFGEAPFGHVTWIPKGCIVKTKVIK